MRKKKSQNSCEISCFAVTDQKGNNLRENCKIKSLHPGLAHVPCTSSIYCFLKIDGDSIPISHFLGVNDVKTDY